MEKGWVKVYGFGDAYLAEIARQVLSDRGIVSILINKQDSSYRSFGEIELYVRQDDVLRAKNCINELEK